MDQVLIAGAGPTGLVLAYWLSKIGVKVRIIDKLDRAGTTSRAVVVHARTLEYYRQLGLESAFLKKSYKFPAVNLWANAKKVAHINVEEVGRGKSPFPGIFILPQDEHEKLLIEELSKLGVTVERECELIDFQDKGDQVITRIKNSQGQIEEANFKYLAGCDGARSIVRHKLDVGFLGSTYPDLFYVADIVGSGPVLDGNLHISLNRSDFMATFPMSSSGRARLIGVVRNIPEGKTLTWSDVNPLLLKEMKIQVDEVRWFSTYHSHHRVAARFKVGRVFLLGDAGHIHSPVGGQGMNTGIGDAVNLAWKLGSVINDGMSEKILETYETERINFAQKLVRTTDRVFNIVTSKGAIAKFIRMNVVPNVLPVVSRLSPARQFLFKTISQTALSYRGSEMHERGKVASGDRLPWIESLDNYSPLKSLKWQIHMYGSETSGPGDASIETHYFNWRDELNELGLIRGAAYLIRPDGYIGVVSPSGSFDKIKKYLEDLHG